MRFRKNAQTRRTFTRLSFLRLEERLTPAIYDIADGDVAGLVAAINAANTDNQPDTINLAAGGTYTFTTRADDSLGGNALPQVALDGGISSNFLTINGNGATVQRSSADGFRFMKIGPSTPGGGAADVNINDLTVTGFSALTPTDASTPAGGALFVNGANVHLTNCVLTNDAAQMAGAIEMLGTPGQTLTLDQCTITNNQGGLAAIDLQGPDLVLNGGSIVSNDSGGISFQTGSTCSITGTVIQNNGGDGVNATGQVTVRQATVSGNAGTGIDVQGLLTLIATTVSGNGTAGTAATGGVSILGSSDTAASFFSMINSTIDGNQGTTVGGININSGSVATFQAAVSSSTIADNAATAVGAIAGGIRVSPETSGFIVRIGDTVIAGNTSGGGAPDLSGPFNSQGYDFISDATGATNVGLTAGNQFGTAGARSTRCSGRSRTTAARHSPGFPWPAAL